MAEGTGNYNTKAEWRNGRLCFVMGDDSALNTNGALQFGATETSAILMGGGTSSSPLIMSSADKNYVGWWLSSSSATGTTRGEYIRLYLTGGAGGEAIRAYTTNSAAAPVDTVNGAHISVSHTGSGNVSGQASAERLTYHVPNGNLGGTNATAQLDLWADGASSAITGNASFIRATLGGNATGAAAIEDTAYLLSISGGSNASGNIVGAAGNEPTWASNTYLVRCNLNGQVAYLVAVKV